jgi:hypothetical protein
MAKLETATLAPKNVVKSEHMIITVKHDKTIEVAYKKNNPKKLPKIGEEHPEKPGTYIEAEDGTPQAVSFATIKWHHHSDCITLDIGGAQYQICWP